MIVYYGCYYGFAGQTMGDWSDGRPSTLWGFSFMCSTVNIVVVLLKAALITQHWVLLDHIVIWGGFVVYILIAWVYTLMNFEPVVANMLVDEVFSPLGLLTMLVVTVACMLPDFAYTAYVRWYTPLDIHILRVRAHAALSSARTRVFVCNERPGALC